MKPLPLTPGDEIAVVAPASAPLDPSSLVTGVAYLERLGFRVTTGRDAYTPNGYLAGTDAERLSELNAALARDDVKAIFCVRGGFGTLRLLPQVDYKSAARHPKLLIGYSDITALHLALYHRAGLRGIAGAMVAVDWADPDAESEAKFWELLSGVTPLRMDGPGGSTLEPMRPGEAEGVLLGGNLTLVSRLIGTPYLPDLGGSILFFEEVGEEPYRIDGLLAHLKLSGVLDAVAGVVVGEITGSTPRHERPTLQIRDVLDHYLGELPCPVARGLRFGHVREKLAVPVGVRARLQVDSTRAELTVLESVVRT